MSYRKANHQRRTTKTSFHKKKSVIREGHGVVRGEVIRRSEPGQYGDDWGYATVLDADHESFKISGTLAEIEVGMCIEARGVWDNHPKYGASLRLDFVCQDTPKTINAIQQWAAQYLPNIGPERAKALTDRFDPEKLFDIIRDEPEKLLTISGINQPRVDEIVTAAAEYEAFREEYVALAGFGFTAKEIGRIYKMGLRGEARERLKEDPFILYDEDPKFTFERLDQIRSELGLSSDHSGRILCGIKVCVQKLTAQRGHTVCDYGVLRSRAAHDLSQDDYQIDKHVDALCGSGLLVMYGEGVQLSRVADAEQTIANKILEMTDHE